MKKMKRSNLAAAAVSMLLAAVLVIEPQFTAYAMFPSETDSTVGNGAMPETQSVPQVYYVEISPHSATLKTGDMQQFSAYVDADPGADTGITWDLYGSNGSSYVDSNGVLRVGEQETAKGFELTAYSHFNNYIKDSVEITVKKRHSVTIATNSLPDGQVKAGYSTQLSAAGDGISWGITSGSLPDGLNLNSNGQISGTASKQGSFGFTAAAFDSYGNSAQKGYTIVINGKKTLDKPTISPQSGIYNSPQQVTLNSPDGAQIYYQLDGNNPDPGTLYTAPIAVNASCYLKAVCRKDGMNDSDIATYGFNITGPAFVPVQDIRDLPDSANAGVPINLAANVLPANATNKQIIYTVLDQGTTGAVINGTTFLASAGGTANISAIILNGTGAKVNYTKTFNISVVPVADNTKADAGGTANTPGSSSAGSNTSVARSYRLKVTGGTGDGAYTRGTMAAIQASSAPEGEIFRQWTTDSDGVFEDEYNPDTTFTMPGADAEVTAVFDVLPDTANFTVDQNVDEIQKGEKLTFTLDNNYNTDKAVIIPQAIVVNGTDKAVKNTEIKNGKSKSYAIKFSKPGYYDIAMKYKADIKGAPDTLLTDNMTIVVNDGKNAPNKPSYSTTAEYILETDGRYPYTYTYFPIKSSSKKNTSSGIIKIDNAWHDSSSVIIDEKDLGSIMVYGDENEEPLYQHLMKYEKDAKGNKYLCLWVDYDGKVSVHLTDKLNSELKALGLTGIKINNTMFTWKNFE